MAARQSESGGSGGTRAAAAAAAWRTAALEVKMEKNPWPGQGVAAVVWAAAAARKRAAATEVGLLPWPFVSSHLRWRRLLSFSNDS